MPRLRLPELQRPVLATTRDALAVRGPVNTVNLVAMPRQREPGLLQVAQRPHLDGVYGAVLVLRRGHEQTAVGSAANKLVDSDVPVHQCSDVAKFPRPSVY